MRLSIILKVMNIQWCCGEKETPEDLQENPKLGSNSVRMENHISSSIETPYSKSRSSSSIMQSTIQRCLLRITVLESDYFPANYVFNISPESTSMVFESRIPEFSISFDESIDRYFLTNYTSGFLIKLNEPLVLRKKTMISFSLAHMVISVREEDIEIQIVAGPRKGETFSFAKDQKVTVGRMVDCSISFEDSGMSRYQCSIYHDSSIGWIILDGDGVKNSMNGTWFFTEKILQVKDGMMFKCGTSLYTCKLIYSF